MGSGHHELLHAQVPQGLHFTGNPRRHGNTDLGAEALRNFRVAPEPNLGKLRGAADDDELGSRLSEIKCGFLDPLQLFFQVIVNETPHRAGRVQEKKAFRKNSVKLVDENVPPRGRHMADLGPPSNHDAFLPESADSFVVKISLKRLEPSERMMSPILKNAGIHPSPARSVHIRDCREFFANGFSGTYCSMSYPQEQMPKMTVVNRSLRVCSRYSCSEL